MLLVVDIHVDVVVCVQAKRWRIVSLAGRRDRIQAPIQSTDVDKAEYEVCLSAFVIPCLCTALLIC